MNFRASRAAAAPVTAGHAIEVPSQAAYPPGTAETTATPGAVRSISGPTLENAAMKFARSVP